MAAFRGLWPQCRHSHSFLPFLYLYPSCIIYSKPWSLRPKSVSSKHCDFSCQLEPLLQHDRRVSGFTAMCSKQGSSLVCFKSSKNLSQTHIDIFSSSVTLWTWLKLVKALHKKNPLCTTIELNHLIKHQCDKLAVT